MRNEIWALVSYLGAPSWFITFAPTDVKHPLALYFADTKKEYTPEFRVKEERLNLIANNPVAGARFFHVIVELFIKHVLGVEINRRGLYGDTAGYYGTVEQQGRLTLHLHMLLWIRNSLTPQEVRDRIMDPASNFQKAMVEYLENCHKGEFINGTMETMAKKPDQDKISNPTKIPLTESLPKPPPHSCKDEHEEGAKCLQCEKYRAWWKQYKDEVDEIVYQSNVHKCKDRLTVYKKVKKVKMQTKAKRIKEKTRLN